MIQKLTATMTKAAAAMSAGDTRYLTTCAKEAVYGVNARSMTQLKLIDQAYCVQGLLELGRALGRFDELQTANNFFAALENKFPQKSDVRQQIALARLDVFEEAVARGSSANLPMMAFMIDPLVVDVAALPGGRRLQAALSLFDFTERLIDTRGDVSGEDRMKHDGALAMAASVLEVYAQQEIRHTEAMSPVYVYADALKKNADLLKKDIIPVDCAKLRAVAKHSVSSIKEVLTPDAGLAAAFAKLSGTKAPRTQFYDVVFKQTSTTPRVAKKRAPTP